MCRYFYIGVYDYMLKGQSLLDYTNLSSTKKTKNKKKNDKTILKYFQQLKCLSWKNILYYFQ